MGWEKRKRKNYYYRKHRRGDQVISEYIGDPQLAELAAAQDLRRRQSRQAEQQALAKIQALNAQVDDICLLIQTLTQAYLLTAGFHTHRGQWRKKRNAKEQPTMSDNHSLDLPDPLSQLRELAHKINKQQPDPADLQRLRDLFDAYPDLWRTIADLAQNSLNALLNQVKDRPVFTEALKYKLANLKIELAYETASAIERLVIEHVLQCWLHLYVTELSYTQFIKEHPTLTASAHWDKHLTSAQHRFLQACRALATISKVTRTTPALQVNIATHGGQQINTVG